LRRRIGGLNKSKKTNIDVEDSRCARALKVPAETGMPFTIELNAGIVVPCGIYGKPGFGAGFFRFKKIKKTGSKERR